MSQVVAQMQATLGQVGFPSGPADGVVGPATRTAVARFQLAYAWRPIGVDGLYGPQTLGALAQVQQTGRLSPNFSVSELRSKGDGSCHVHRDLLTALERLRTAVGTPLPIVSGWRDVAHNRRVGGAASSQHTFGRAPELDAIAARLDGTPRTAGRAADIPRNYIRLEDCVRLGLFGGIGHRNGWVTHVDIRPGSTVAPTIWVYG
jgi:peptidoglycan hydrolase-like protein with peptidoglycan-binding domain